MLGASVTVTNEATDEKYYATTDRFGRFCIDKLFTDYAYTISISKFAYGDIEFKGVTLESKKENHLDVQMEIK